MPIGNIPSPSLAAEQAIANYISASFSGSIQVFSGIDNADKINPPAVIVYCKSANEVYFNTRNYNFDIEIQLHEMAADVTEQNFSNTAGSVFALFADSVTSSAAINATTTGIKFWQIQIMNYNEDTSGDAWRSNYDLRFVGALTPY